MPERSIHDCQRHRRERMLMHHRDAGRTQTIGGLLKLDRAESRETTISMTTLTVGALLDLHRTESRQTPDIGRTRTAGGLLKVDRDILLHNQIGLTHAPMYSRSIHLPS